jgi:hypothetical protein
MLLQVIAPATAYALTSGPTQPEVQAFEPMGTTDMVDLFTGDYTYNIPLFELPGPSGGYPFNLSYHSGIGMDDEASWVGLGWSLNPGVINRSMRGLPDEFNGDEVKKTVDMKPNRTYGLGAGGNVEIFGLGNLGLGLTLYRNNYRGFGYRVNAGIGMDFGLVLLGGLLAKARLDVTLDSQEGVGVNPSLSITDIFEESGSSFGIGLGYNSRRGMTDLSLGFTVGWKKEHKSKRYALRGASSAGISFASTAYTPSVAYPYHGNTMDVLVKTGGAFFGVFGNFSLSGFFNESYLKDRGTERSIGAFGYWNMHQSGNKNLTDFNREKDGAIRRETPNLGIPSMTYDYYSIAGQGTGGMFRPFRNSNHIISDQITSSTMASSSAGVDFGAGHIHLGANASMSLSQTDAGPWDTDNQFKSAFESGSNEVDNEAFYLKVNGEHTTDPVNDMDHLLGDKPAAVKLEREATLLTFKAKDQLIDNAGNTGTITSPADPGREPRNVVVSSVTNDEVGDNNEILGEYAVEFYDTDDNQYDDDKEAFVRASRPGHHPAGFTNLNSQGQRYVYALPAYNNKHVEATFSVEAQLNCASTISYNGDYKVANTNQFLDKTEIPEYAHSYLLTSVLGPDYVDLDGIPGPSEGDVGYWVKFDYVKTSSDYKWRAPFSQANYDQGIMSDYTDDRGSYMYGERETWYLASAQTKTHIAEFHISTRDDAISANSELQNSDTFDVDRSSYKLDKIMVFSRKDRFPGGTYNAQAAPLQTVELRHSYSLCQDLPNSKGSNGSDGKLTLDSLWFAYESSTRGAMSPYVFQYDGQNPDYEPSGNDRWGYYKPGATGCGHIWNPYVEQYNGAVHDTTFQNQKDEYASAWHLTSINLPSGATIEVDYEADDYSYVQDKRAMQMTPIYSLSSTPSTNTISHGPGGADNLRRVYFELEDPLAPSETGKLQQYIEGISELYFKTRIKTRQTSEVFEDFVSGYVPIKGIYFDTGVTNGSGKYTHAYLVLDYITYGNKTIEYHPFSVAAWQYLRSTNPVLLKQPNLPLPDNGNISAFNKVMAVKSLLSPFNDIRAIFEGVFDYCYDRHFGEQIDLDYSWVRLNSPDKKKYGGGVRVNRIVMNDGWDSSTSGESANEYGNVYEYTEEENGETISSGVAAYEPMVGGDENPFRKAKMYLENVPLIQPTPLFFENPANESYFPAPVVGYRTVTVKSLATDGVITGTIAGQPVTTGATRHEFFTAKDYPVQTEETFVDMNAMPTLTIPLGPFGSTSTNNTYASQGYSIVLNDMHGKIRKVTNYRQDINHAILYNSPISSVQYKYFDKSNFVPATGQTNYTLVNELPTLVFDVDENDLTRSKVENRLIGQDFDFVVDMRSVRTVSVKGGLQLNTDIIFPLAIPTIWPNLGLHSSLARTAVTNKIIHRAGILHKVTAMTEGSTVTTENIYFDALTGRPLLTKVNNAWEDPIYKYEYPAHWAYDQMGAAYKNIGLRIADVAFTAWAGNSDHAEVSSGIAADVAALLVPGDEFIAWTGSNGKKAVFLGDFDGDLIFNFEDNSIPGSTTDLLLTRSGRRNHLSQNVQEITALKDPTHDRDYYGCYRDLEFPGTVIDSIDTIQVVAPCVDNLLALMTEIFPVSTSLDEYHQLDQSPYSQYTDYCVACTDSAIAHYRPDTDSLIIEFGANPSVDPCCEIGFITGSDKLLDPLVLDSIVNPQLVPTFPGTALPTDATYSGIQVTYYVEGDPNPYTAYLYYQEHLFNGNGCGNFTEDRYVTYLTNSTGDYTLLDTIFSIDSVLSAVATTFSDGWSQDFSSLQFRNDVVSKVQALRDKHPFYTGERGVWRPWQSYVFRADRRQSADVNLREDGTFGNVPIFNFNGLIFTACGQEWVRTNEVVRYQPGGQETENRNVLDVYSAALFGYGGGIPIAVASNARQHELAFESFEEYSDGASIDQFEVSRGNLDIYNDYQTVASNDPYQVLIPEWLIAGENTTAITNTPYPVGFSSSTRDKVDVRSDGSVFNPSVNFAASRDLSSVVNHSSNAQYVLSRAPDLHGKASGTVFAGKVQVDQPLAFQTSSTVLNRVDFTDEKAHTGEMCMQLEGIAIFPQNRFRPEPGTTYVLSAWVSREEVNQYTYRQNLFPDSNRIGMKVSYLDSAGAVISSSLLYEPVGKNVEGWQKIEAEFTVPAYTERISLKLQSGQDKYGTDIVAYFDDIRFNPLTSNMKSYVYDPDNLRLQAVMDPNNYATRYHYDEQGQLFLVKKETERGIKTIQESRTFVRE